MAPRDISFLPTDLRRKARFWENGEVMWPRDDAVRVIDAVADSGRIIFGFDVEKYAEDGTFIERPWTRYDRDPSLTHPENVQRSRAAATAALAAIEPETVEQYHEDWVNLTWSDPA